MAQGWEACWERAATLADAEWICVQAGQRLDGLQLSPQDRFAVELLLREALVNAVRHGGRLNAGQHPADQQNDDQKITCRLCAAGGEILIEVQDQGPGFDWRAQMGQVHSQLDESGRGLVLYKLYASSYEFNPIGNCITLRRSVRCGAASAAAPVPTRRPTC